VIRGLAGFGLEGEINQSLVTSSAPEFGFFGMGFYKYFRP
jgi:hypothetical protein